MRRKHTDQTQSVRVQWAGPLLPAQILHYTYKTPAVGKTTAYNCYKTKTTQILKKLTSGYEIV